MAISNDTQATLYDAIKTTTDQVMAADGNPAVRAKALQSLALAYRYLSGGAQPGSVVVEK
jgi:hypothetical protein